MFAYCFTRLAMDQFIPTTTSHNDTMMDLRSTEMDHLITVKDFIITENVNMLIPVIEEGTATMVNFCSYQLIPRSFPSCIFTKRSFTFCIFRYDGRSKFRIHASSRYGYGRAETQISWTAERWRWRPAGRTTFRSWRSLKPAVLALYERILPFRKSLQISSSQ